MSWDKLNSFENRHQQLRGTCAFQKTHSNINQISNLINSINWKRCNFCVFCRSLRFFVSCHDRKFSPSSTFACRKLQTWLTLRFTSSESIYRALPKSFSLFLTSLSLFTRTFPTQRILPLFFFLYSTTLSPLNYTLSEVDFLNYSIAGLDEEGLCVSMFAYESERE